MLLEASGPSSTPIVTRLLLTHTMLTHTALTHAPLQEAACAVLLEAAAAKPAVTAAEVSKLRDRFRSKHYIERVLAACAAAQAAKESS